MVPNSVDANYSMPAEQSTLRGGYPEVLRNPRPAGEVDPGSLGTESPQLVLPKIVLLLRWQPRGCWGSHC